MHDVLSTLKNEILIHEKTTLIVSVSGGMDSMALLHLLMQLPAKIVVVHFNHMKRSASIDEAKMVESYAKTYHLNYHYYTLELSNQNFQHQAHKMRMHYLKEVAHIYKTPFICTAHHLDDLLESILIKLTKGSNILGYAGMQYMHKKNDFIFIKPFLYTEKTQISSYITQHQVPFMDDHSNASDDYLRNRYRHTVTPIMKQENSSILEQVKTFHYQLTQAFKYIRKQSLVYLNAHHHINLATYIHLDDVLKDDIVAYLIESNHVKTNHRTVVNIKRMLLSDKPNQRYQISQDLYFIKAYKKAYIKPLISHFDGSIELKEGQTKVKNMSIFTFFSKTSAVTEDFYKLCYNKLAFPLRLRHKKDGDVLAYDYGHKKLKKLLIDQKVPLEKRKSLWVLTDRDDLILWVESFYINQTLGKDHTLYFKIMEDQHAQ